MYTQNRMSKEYIKAVCVSGVWDLNGKSQAHEFQEENRI